MPILWRPTMAVGDATVDADHRRLIDLINGVEAVLVSGGAHAGLGVALDHLTDYVRQHFEREENLMRQTGYNGLIHHREAHRDLRARLIEIRAGIEATKVDTITADEIERVVELLRHWLLDHVLKEDMLLRDFLRRGV